MIRTTAVQTLKAFAVVISAAGLILSASSASAADGEAVFNKVCQMCHKKGVGGAPKYGDKDAWAPRIAQGKPTLYDHALHGFKGKGTMPAKGGRKSLSDDEVKAAVDFMVSAAQ